MSAVSWLAALAFLLAGGLAGYVLAILTGTPLVAAWQERQQVEREARLAELRLRHLSHQAMRRLLDEARDG